MESPIFCNGFVRRLRLFKDAVRLLTQHTTRRGGGNTQRERGGCKTDTTLLKKKNKKKVDSWQMYTRYNHTDKTNHRPKTHQNALKQMKYINKW